MKYKINHALIEKIQNSHFGDVTEKVMQNLISGKCCGIYGLPGYGMEFFAKHILHLIQQNYPEFGTLLINVDHNKNDLKIFKKYDLENYLKNNKLILVLAEVLSPKYEIFYNYVNYLKWMSKDNLSVLTVANYTLYSQQDYYLKVGLDIFQPIYLVKSFDYNKTLEVIELNNSEYNWNIPLSHAKKIYELGGGIPALTKYICMAMYEEGMHLLDDPIQLINTQPLKKRIQDLNILIMELTLEQMRHLGLLNSQNKFTSTLLRYYLDHEDLNELSFVFSDLSKNEKRILKCFIDTPTNVLNKDQIALILGQDLDSYSEWAIYKSVERLKSKISDIFNIESLYGRGWLLKKK